MATAGSGLCPPCRRRVRAELVDLPRLYLETEHRLGSPYRMGVERVSGSKTVGIVLSDSVMETREQVVSGLASWAALVADQRALTPPHREIRELAAFLLRNLDWLARHEAVGDLTAELTELTVAARIAAYRESSRHFRLGPCAHHSCEQPVLATVTATESTDDCLVACLAGHEWPMHRWIELNLETRDAPPSSDAARETAPDAKDGPPRTLPTPMAAAAVGVPQATVRKWASRGKLTRHGSPTRPEYDLRELAALAESAPKNEQLRPAR